MEYYKYKFHVNQTQKIAFEYFVRREYIKRPFQEPGGDKVEIITDHESPSMTEGESFDLTVMDDDSFMTFRFEVLKIIPLELIETSFRLIEMLDREEGTLEDDMETTNFLNKYLGQSLTYSIQLKPQKDKVEVIESGTVETSGLISKLFFKALGLYHRIKQRSIYKEIQKEVESFSG